MQKLTEENKALKAEVVQLKADGAQQGGGDEVTVRGFSNSSGVVLLCCAACIIQLPVAHNVLVLCLRNSWCQASVADGGDCMLHGYKDAVVAKKSFN